MDPVISQTKKVDTGFAISTRSTKETGPSKVKLVIAKHVP